MLNVKAMSAGNKMPCPRS